MDAFLGLGKRSPPVSSELLRSFVDVVPEPNKAASALKVLEACWLHVEVCKHVGTGLEMREENQITGIDSFLLSPLDSTPERVSNLFWCGGRQESG